MTELTTRMWIKADSSFKYPEQTLTDITSRPNIGVCFSGGGTRAMSAAMGQMRALNQYKLFPAIRYISCVSGGSWASTIFCYYRTGATGDDDLLGPVTPAEKITQRHLDTSLTSAHLAYGATKWLAGIIAEWELFPDFEYTSNDVWIYSISEAYLQDFGLFDAHSAAYHPSKLPYYSWDDNSVADIKAKNPTLEDSTFYTSRPNRPYLIVNSCILLPQDKPTQDGNVHFEYTPLTVGRGTLSESQGRTYGGGFIEPFAFRSQAPEGSGPWSNGAYVQLSGQDRPFTLADTTGTSSSAYAEVLIDDFSISRFDPKSEYFPVQPSGPLNSAQTFFGDGGILENQGIIPLLQRGVTTIFAFINTEAKLSLDYHPNSNGEDPSNDPNGYCDTSLPALFGYSHSTWKWQYPNNQVFPTVDFPKLIAEFQNLKKQGLPLVVGTQHQVVANSSWGIEAQTNPVTIVWFYLDRVTQWEKKIPNHYIQKQIEQGNQSYPEGPFKNFPNYKTIGQNDFDLVALSHQQIVLLADLACDAMLWKDSSDVAAIFQQAVSQANTDGCVKS